VNRCFWWDSANSHGALTNRKTARAEAVRRARAEFAREKSTKKKNEGQWEHHHLGEIIESKYEAKDRKKKPARFATAHTQEKCCGEEDESGDDNVRSVRAESDEFEFAIRE
jgi:hypothetical protein